MTSFSGSFKFILTIAIWWITFDQLSADTKKTVCLNMIVKDETKVITRCLASVKPLIDYWVIVDTGSTDGTQKMIQEYMKDIPGELHERPWKNFAHNRNEALQFAQNKADYVLVIDADEVLVLPKDYNLPLLDKDFYFIKTHFGNTHYDRVQLINNHLDWKWEGVLHEGLASSDAHTCDRLADVFNYVRTDGNRSEDPHKYDKDAAILENALKDDPYNKRYQFYLAQSYRDAQQPGLALKNYQKRVEMGGWDQEIFWSLLQIGLMQEALNADSNTIQEAYIKAYQYRPSRIEPLYRLVNYHRRNENHLAGYQAALQGLGLRDSSDLLFVEKWIYDYGLVFEFSICAYWVEKYTESLLASYLTLATPDLPENIRKCVEQNLVWIKLKIEEKSKSDHAEAANKDQNSISYNP